MPFDEIIDFRFDTLNLDYDDELFTPNPGLEALDLALETNFNTDFEEHARPERLNFDAVADDIYADELAADELDADELIREIFVKCCDNADELQIFHINDADFEDPAEDLEDQAEDEVSYFNNKPKLMEITKHFNKSKISTLIELSKYFNVCDVLYYITFNHCCDDNCINKSAEEKIDCSFERKCVLCLEINKVYKNNCDCYLCNIDGNDEVNNFNKLNKTCFDSINFNKLKTYAEDNEISLEDAIYYSQTCHNCDKAYDYNNYSYGDTYCSVECNLNIEKYKNDCHYIKNGEDCKLCKKCCNNSYVYEDFKIKFEEGEKQIKEIDYDDFDNYCNEEIEKDYEDYDDYDDDYEEESERESEYHNDDYNQDEDEDEGIDINMIRKWEYQENQIKKD